MVHPPVVLQLHLDLLRFELADHTKQTPRTYVCVLGRFHDARDGRERASSYMPRSISGEYARFEWIMSLELESFLRQMPAHLQPTTRRVRAISRVVEAMPTNEPLSTSPNVEAL